MTNETYTRPEPGDILREKERNGTITFWVSQEYLQRIHKGLGDTYLRQKARYEYSQTVSQAKRHKETLPDTGSAWRFSKRGGKFYYAYANIPDNKPTCYKSGLGDIEALYKTSLETGEEQRLSALESEVKGRLEAIESDYWHNYYGYSTEQMYRLARAAAALDLCIEMGRERGLIGVRSKAFIQDFGEVLKRLSIGYIPTNWRRLNDKVEAVLSGSTVSDVVTLPREGNQCARKFDDMEIESWVYQMRGMGQNYTNAYIIRKVQKLCDLTGKKVPSTSWFNEVLAEAEAKFLTSAGRYGDRGRQGQIHKGYTPTQNALFAGDCWQADGTRVNFLPWKNEAGKQEFLYVIVIRDVHSGAVLGGHFGINEDRNAYMDALRNAVSMTGHLPYELIIDRFPGHNTSDWQLVESRVKAMGVKVSYKHKATGKAQLERWFETLQSVFFHESPYYYGEGIQSRRQHAHRSAEYLKKQRQVAKMDGWGMDAARLEAMRCMEAYNKTPLKDYSRKHASVGETPSELWEKSEKPHVKILDAAHKALILGKNKGISIRNNMIRTQIDNMEYLYAIEDIDVLKYPKVLLAYDPENLGVAHLFDGEEDSLNPRYIATIDVMERVLVFGPDADMKALGKDQKRVGDIEKARQKRLADKIAQGSEVDMLLGGMGNKADAENAENEWLDAWIPDQPADSREDDFPETQTPEDDIIALMRQQY